MTEEQFTADVLDALLRHFGHGSDVTVERFAEHSVRVEVPEGRFMVQTLRLPSSRERLDHGWLVDGVFICDGCNVRVGHEHRCFRGDATWADPRQVCTCEECNAP